MEHDLYDLGLCSSTDDDEDYDKTINGDSNELVTTDDYDRLLAEELEYDLKTIVEKNINLHDNEEENDNDDDYTGKIDEDSSEKASTLIIHTGPIYNVSVEYNKHKKKCSDFYKMLEVATKRPFLDSNKLIRTEKEIMKYIADYYKLHISDNSDDQQYYYNSSHNTWKSKLEMKKNTRFTYRFYPYSESTSRYWYMSKTETTKQFFMTKIVPQITLSLKNVGWKLESSIDIFVNYIIYKMAPWERHRYSQFMRLWILHIRDTQSLRKNARKPTIDIKQAMQLIHECDNMDIQSVQLQFYKLIVYICENKHGTVLWINWIIIYFKIDPNRFEKSSH